MFLYFTFYWWVFRVNVEHTENMKLHLFELETEFSLFTSAAASLDKDFIMEGKHRITVSGAKYIY